MVSFRVFAWKEIITFTAEDAEVLYLTERTESQSFSAFSDNPGPRRLSEFYKEDQELRGDFLAT